MARKKPREGWEQLGRRRLPKPVKWIGGLLGVLVAGLLAGFILLQTGWVDSQFVKLASRDLQDIGYTEQAEMLADGKVTDEEYEAAFGLFQDCLDRNGVAMPAFYTSPLDGFTKKFSFDFESMDRDAKEASAGCTSRYWDAVMVYYSEAHDGALVPDLREAVAQCVTSKGYKVSGKESLPQDFGSRFNSERTAAARQCVEEELERLYPEAAHLPFSMLD